jgi:hypothetical protein
MLHYQFNCFVLTLYLRIISMLLYLSLLVAFYVYFRMLYMHLIHGIRIVKYECNFWLVSYKKLISFKKFNL